MDMVFLVEASDVMLNKEWAIVTAWVKKIVDTAKKDPTNDIASVVVVIRFRKSFFTTTNLLNERIAQMKLALQHEAVLQHVVSDTYKALDYANTAVYDNLRHGSKKILVMVTDGMDRS